VTGGGVAGGDVTGCDVTGGGVTGGYGARIVSPAAAEPPSCGSGSGASGASNNKNLEKYSKCVNDAGTDAAKRRQCTDLLTSP